MSIQDKVNPERLSSLFMIVLSLMFAAVIATALGFVLGVNNDPKEVLGNMDIKIPAGKSNNPSKNKETGSSVTGSDLKEKEDRSNTPPGLVKKEVPTETTDITSEKLSLDKTTKPVKAPKGYNGPEFKRNITEAATGLSDVSKTVKELEFKEDVSDEIDEVVEEIKSEVVNEKAAQAIEEVEKRPKWKNVLFGTDYKNLGLLRSAMVKNQNAVRKLNQIQTKIQNEEASSALQQHTSTLLQEQERISAIIEENEDSFSLLGWAFRFLSGYDPLDEDAQEEQEEIESEEVRLDNEDDLSEELDDDSEEVEDTDSTI